MESDIAIRLKLFFEYAGLTSSQFADTCGIARPTLSQLLTGRNKKISDVLIAQIHHAYPKLSIMWLLFGEGDMMSGSGVSTSGVTSEKLSEPGNDSDADENAEESKVNDSHNNGNNAYNQEIKGISPNFAPKVEIIAPPPVVRKIAHITVYYDDSTFETFYPKA